MRTNSGLTLLEVLIAISLLVLVIFAGSGIYLSGMNLSADAQYSAQAHRNAQVVMMHIEKTVRQSASEFDIRDGGNRVIFNTYRSGQSDYVFSNETDLITYTPDISHPGDHTVVFNHISNCTFNIIPHDGVVLNVMVEAFDNNNRAGNTCRLETSVEAAYSSSSRM